MFCTSDEPRAPGRPEVAETDSDHISIKWTSPESDGGSPITGYDIERKEATSAKWTKLNIHAVKVCLYRVLNDLLNKDL